MDLLKDITDGLRGDDEDTERNGKSGTAANASRDGDASADRTDDTTDRDATDDATDRDDGVTDRDAGDSAGERERDDEHVCSFCQTEFDADRGSCPECDAEIVLRGTK